MTKREKIIEILNNYSYGGTAYVADKILALGEVLSEVKIFNIIESTAYKQGVLIPTKTMEAMANALSGKIAKSQEPECTCITQTIGAGIITNKDCPLHGRKEGKLEHLNFYANPDDGVIGSFASGAINKINELVDAINKLNGEG